MVEIVQSLSVCHCLVGLISLLHMNTCCTLLHLLNAGWYFYPLSSQSVQLEPSLTVSVTVPVSHVQPTVKLLSLD